MSKTRLLNRVRSQRGFNLLELMIMITIMGILIAIALPNYFSAQDRSKLAGVKANMHTFQTIIESYAIDWGGVYAPTVAALRTEGTVEGRGYWKEFSNPFTATEGEGISYADALVLPAPVSSSAGQVLYSPVTDGPSPIIKYYVYGLGKAGQPMRDKGEPFTLTNG